MRFVEAKRKLFMCSFLKLSNDLKIIFLNFIWKTKIHKVIGNSQWNKAFLQNKIIIYIIQILTSLKTALKNYTWKVCVLPQQNAFGRPFSLKKHEEMFCDFAKTSGFFGESRHTKCISLGEMHIHDFSLIFFQADFSKKNSNHLAPREIEDWLIILHGLVQFRVLKSMLKQERVEFRSGAVAPHKLESFWPCGGGKQGGGSNHHTPDDLALRSRGRRILFKVLKIFTKNA